jgi:REP element-mobilizing transposase RayT
LPTYDYAQAGYYFVTIATYRRMHLFGEVIDGQMVLNMAGEMIERLWHEIPNTALHEHIIMPNHIHGIIEITDPPVGAPLVGAHQNPGISTSLGNINPRATTRVAPTDKSLGDIIGVFKSLTTNAYIQMVKSGTLPPFDRRIWQRNFYEHVIRNKRGQVNIITIYGYLGENISNDDQQIEMLVMTEKFRIRR